MTEAYRPAPFGRRLLALLYDSIAVLTLLYFAGFIPVIAAGGQAIEPGNPLFTVYLSAVLYGYFAVCWTRGSTLGMQAWKLAIVAGDGSRRPHWREALLRFLGAGVVLGSAGAGYIAALFDANGRAWHDRWSRTQLIRRPLSGRASAESTPPPAAARSDPAH